MFRAIWAACTPEGSTCCQGERNGAVEIFHDIPEVHAFDKLPGVQGVDVGAVGTVIQDQDFLERYLDPLSTDKSKSSRVSVQSKDRKCNIPDCLEHHQEVIDTEAKVYQMEENGIPSGKLCVFGHQFVTRGKTVLMQFDRDFLSNSYRTVTDQHWNDKILFTRGTRGRTVCDPDGTVVFSLPLQPNDATVQPVMCVDCNGRAYQLFEVALVDGTAFARTTPIHRYLSNKAGVQFIVQLNLDMNVKFGSILWQEDAQTRVVIAQITGGKAHADGYSIEVAEGVDTALVLALALGVGQLSGSFP